MNFLHLTFFSVFISIPSLSSCILFLTFVVFFINLWKIIISSSVAYPLIFRHIFNQLFNKTRRIVEISLEPVFLIIKILKGFINLFYLLL